MSFCFGPHPHKQVCILVRNAHKGRGGAQRARQAFSVCLDFNQGFPPLARKGRPSHGPSAHVANKRAPVYNQATYISPAPLHDHCLWFV